MALRLTSKLRAQLARASEALLTPPEQGNLAAWREDVRVAVGALLRADAISLRLPAHVLPAAAGEDVPPTLDLAFREASARPTRAVALGRVRQGAYMAAVITTRPRHVAGLLWSRRVPDPGLPRAAEIELLRLLYPVFKAGVAACIGVAERRPLLCAALEGLAEGAALLDGSGRTVHRNQALLELLAAEPDADRLLQAGDALVAGLHGRGPAAHAEGTRAADVETRTARYRLFGTILEPGAASPVGSSILLVIEPRSPRLPAAASLRRRFGLSRREAEVALLLAQGRRNSHVAESLGISPHTARHHTEMVLAKLGSRSRAEVGAVLLGA